MKVKLTQAQFNLLVELSNGAPHHYSHSYKPSVRLVELGLVELRPGRWSNDEWMRITGAGQLRLAMEKR